MELLSASWGIAMTQVLLITSSLFGVKSKSRQVAIELIDALSKSYAGTHVVERDLYADPLPHLSQQAFLARKVPEEKLTDEQRALLATSVAEIHKLQAADIVVITAPMTNFSIPSALKVWIDHIVAADMTFRYCSGRPEGLLRAKKVFVVSARGNVYAGDAAMAQFDHCEPYLRAVLGFVGLTDVTFIPVEGQGRGPEAAAKGLACARNLIDGILSHEYHQRHA